MKGMEVGEVAKETIDEINTILKGTE